MTAQVQLPIDVNSIRKLLPHRYPFLLVDRVVEFEAHKRVLCFKSVSINEPFFQGHFPAHPVMPGGGLLTQLSCLTDTDIDGNKATDKLFYLVKIDNAKFSKMVVPGDRLELEVVLNRTIRNMALYTGIARVDSHQVACAEILCAEVKT